MKPHKGRRTVGIATVALLSSLLTACALPKLPFATKQPCSSHFSYHSPKPLGPDASFLRAVAEAGKGSRLVNLRELARMAGWRTDFDRMIVTWSDVSILRTLDENGAEQPPETVPAMLRRLVPTVCWDGFDEYVPDYSQPGDDPGPRSGSYVFLRGDIPVQNVVFVRSDSIISPLSHRYEVLATDDLVPNGETRSLSLLFSHDSAWSR